MVKPEKAKSSLKKFKIQFVNLRVPQCQMSLGMMFKVSMFMMCHLTLLLPAYHCRLTHIRVTGSKRVNSWRSAANVGSGITSSQQLPGGPHEIQGAGA